MDKVVHSSECHTWQTPDSFLDLVRQVGPIVLDPCTSPENPTSARWFCAAQMGGMGGGLFADGQASFDGLTTPWALFGGLTFCNPPYGRSLGAWAAKCVEEARLGAEIVLLVPARPDTSWFAHLWAAEELLFWRGRLKFKGATAGAPFPSAVAYWGPHTRRFREAFGAHGQLVRRAS